MDSRCRHARMGCRRSAGRHADVPRDRFEQSGLFRVERGRARLCTAPARYALSKIDVFALFDDTGSFEPIIPTLANLFLQLVGEVEAGLPAVDFGFGVGRFEDYGGPGFGFGGESMNGRPFLLDQPIVTSADAGGDDARNQLIVDALSRTAPGNGGDGPEAALEGLYQIATGAGFDGDGHGPGTRPGGPQPPPFL